MRWSREIEKVNEVPEDMYVDGIVPEKQRAFRKGTKIFVNLLRKENIFFTQEESEIFERTNVVAIVVDFLVDEGKISVSDMTHIISRADSDIPSLNKSLIRLRSLIERHGDYAQYLASILRTLSYSSKGKDSIQGRYREALYLAKALAATVRKDGPDREHLETVLKGTISLGNFFDDIMDYKTDKKDVPWMRERRRVAMRIIGKSYKNFHSPHSYWPLVAGIVLLMYSRVLVPDSLNRLGLK